MTNVKRVVYSFRFYGPDRYKVMKILERRLRREYNIYGLKIVKDTIGYVEASIKVLEDPWAQIYDIYRSLNNKCDSFCTTDTEWEMLFDKTYYIVEPYMKYKD